MKKIITVILSVLLIFAGMLVAPAPDIQTKPAKSKVNTDTIVNNTNINITTQAADNTHDKNSQTVYITATGKKYHSTKDCAGLSNAISVTETTLSFAESLRLTPCSKCH